MRSPTASQSTSILITCSSTGFTPVRRNHQAMWFGSTALPRQGTFLRADSEWLTSSRRAGTVSSTSCLPTITIVSERADGASTQATRPSFASSQMEQRSHSESSSCPGRFCDSDRWSRTGVHSGADHAFHETGQSLPPCEYRKYKRGSQPIPGPVCSERCTGGHRKGGSRGANPDTRPARPRTPGFFSAAAPPRATICPTAPLPRHHAHGI